MPRHRMIVDYIPFDEVVKECKNQEIDRVFCRKYELAADLVVRRTSFFPDGCRADSIRRKIWDECLLDGLTVGEVRERIAAGDYNKPSFEGDIVIAAFRGAILLAKS